MITNALQGKHWLRHNHNLYHLFEDGHWQASLRIKGLSGYQSAEVLIGEERYTFEQQGWWRRQVEILDGYDMPIGEIIQPKWSSTNLELEYKERTYTIQSRNIPMVEYRLLKGEVPLLRYGMEWDRGRLHTYRKAQQEELPLLFDVVLWFLFPAKYSSQGWTSTGAIMV